VRARGLGFAFVRVAAVLLCLELVYVAAANAMLRSSLVSDAAASADGFLLEYGGAYTLWPGKVHARDLRLRFEDYNVQFELTLGRTSLSVALRELPFKRFRVTQITAEGARFRMRHKLIVVGDAAQRVAAYPPIRGFADPPYYQGVRPPPIADAEYDLWQVRIENVTAEIQELWIQELRFLGAGLARGSFTVKPARWVQVQPAELRLDSGALTLGEHLVAADARGLINCSVPGMDVQTTEGSEVFREISARLRVRLDRGNLDFLRAYLARAAPELYYSGAADWTIDADIQSGVVQPGMRVALGATPLRVRRGTLTLEGDVAATLVREGAAEQLGFSVRLPRLEARRGGSREGAPSIDDASAELGLNAVRLDQAPSLGAGRARVGRLSAPSLGWFRVPETRLGGSGSASVSLSRAADGSLSGSAGLELADARVRRGDLLVASDLKGALSLSRQGSDAPIRFDELGLSFDRAAVRSGDHASKPFWARLDASGMELKLEPTPLAQGALRLHLSSTEALLPLVVSRTVSDLGGVLVSLGALRASARVKVERGGVDVSGLDARDGELRLQGHVSQRGASPTGRLLVSAGALNVGVRFERGSTDVSPFVGDDWLASAPAVGR
jgi:hypothetical protein